jgi:hypothetical protein
MPILNYTTKIDTHKTISEIQQILAKGGARAIMHQYDDSGNITALSFKIEMGTQEAAFKLPTVWEPVLELMKKDKKVPRRLITKEQALRVAWRITKDWVEAQIAFIQTMNVPITQVFLPYAITRDGTTVYEHIAINNPELLLESGQ